ncbi:MAG: hypothetical protein LBR38_02065 [Synergistaceae bacterium]|nr:hypothetical protein [Synergistaceae bacterium]
MAVALVAALARPAAGGGDAREMLALTTTLLALYGTEQALENEMLTQSKNMTTELTEIAAAALAYETVFREPNYTSDHKALTAVVSRDYGSELLKSSAALAAGVALLSNPGYREPDSGAYIDFKQAYKSRVTEFTLYANALTLLNKTAVDTASDTQAAIADMHKAWSGSESMSYRAVAQAGQQIALFADQQIPRIRTDVQRRLDAEVRFALNDWQERTDVHAAFKQAVREWVDQSPAASY